VSLLPWRNNQDQIQDTQDQVEDNQDQLQELLREIQNTQDQVQGLETSVEDRISQLENEVTQLRGQVTDMLPEMDLTERQKQVVALYMGSNRPRTKQEIADELNISKQYASQLIIQVKDEVDMEVTQVDESGTRAYKLEPHERQKIRQGY
jgi:DNA-directed RNA polymerase sigma subunit (sigma70/sigma32)